ncbi:MAG: hypothetical protein JXO72_10680 [Vicinamibacteria bacterium]|nr:hypothetical protein [Vicinamibacteria bacterium]
MVLVQNTVAVRSPASETLWRNCRNSIRIARLLNHDGGSRALIETACEMAMECACRALLHVHDARFEGGIMKGLRRLSAPLELLEGFSAKEDALNALDLAEQVVAWAASRLRERCSDRSWGY